VLVGPVRDRLRQVTQAVADEHDWHRISLAIQPDHVHLFIRADPSTLPSDIPRLIKGCSAHDLRAEFPQLLQLPSQRTFFQLTQVIAYKPKRLGIRVDPVAPAYTSQTCPACFARNKAGARRYVCTECGRHGHRDRVGAVTIARDTGRDGRSAGATGALGALPVDGPPGTAPNCEASIPKAHAPAGERISTSQL
jgi:hypothetical protein